MTIIPILITLVGIVTVVSPELTKAQSPNCKIRVRYTINYSDNRNSDSIGSGSNSEYDYDGDHDGTDKSDTSRNYNRSQ